MMKKQGGTAKKNRMKVRNFVRMAVGMILLLGMLLSVSGCGKSEKGDLWTGAKYTEDTELGTGAMKILVEVKAEEKSVTFTLHTDQSVLRDALLEQELIEGEQGEYGLYVKVVNGITADYDVDQSYWALMENGEMAMSGVDGVSLKEGGHYELVRTK